MTDHRAQVGQTANDVNNRDATSLNSCSGRHRFSRFLNCWSGPILILGASVVMLIWTWKRWPDVLIDFGRELYVPWQLAEGKILYRDIAAVQGPFSAYFNSLWFRWFGVSLMTLVGCNLVVIAAVLCLLYRLLTAISDRFAATIACLAFVLLFAFPNFSSVGNFNYVCPYRHEATHGMLLSLIAIGCLSVYLHERSFRALAGAGLFTGLVFLTKGELFVAEFCAVSIGLLLALATQPGSKERVLQSLAVFLGASVAGPVLAFLFFWSASSSSEALSAVLGSWPASFSPAFRRSPFVTYGMGLDEWQQNLQILFKWTGYYLGFLTVSALCGLGLRRSGAMPWILSVAVFSLLLLGSFQVVSPWPEILRPLPVVMVVLGCVLLIQIYRRRNEPIRRSKVIVALVLVVFATILLGKMLLRARLFHYGFLLGMPATLLLIVALFGWIPREIERRGGFGGFFVAAAAAVLISTTIWYLKAAELRMRNKTTPVASGADRFFGDRRAIAVNQMLAEISRRVRPEEKLAVVPQGVMLNYLSRRSNSVPYLDLVPTEYFYWGEERIEQAFRRHPPDFVALVHTDCSEFGYRFFGQDYGRGLFHWITSNYTAVAKVGARPFTDGQFGILLLERDKE